MNRFVAISGCSGGGKSTLLKDLARRGHHVVEEPGRRIVLEELEQGGTALPWVDAPAFARRAIELSIVDLRAATSALDWVFFDRGLVDAAAALQHLTNEPALSDLNCSSCYNRNVFLAPPWHEIYETDSQRRHSFSTAAAEYDRLEAVYPSLGYSVHILPKVPVRERADYVITALDHQQNETFTQMQS